jgi:CRP-like cAMP-binding protein
MQLFTERDLFRIQKWQFSTIMRFTIINYPVFSGVGKTWDKLDMQEEDWNLILQGSKTINYRSGAVIIQAGTVPQRVFQIVQGKCRLEKKMPDGSVQSIGSLNTGAMFGEMSFLEGETASISVVADAKVVV